ncbi:MAG TPA: ABC transporter permease subunit [Tepidiformaceae bacterium]
MNTTIFVLTIRQLLGRRRAFLMAAFGLLPIGAAVIFRMSAPNVDAQRWTVVVLLNGLVVTTLLPLVALVFGTSAMGGEIEDGTAVYLLSKPVPRWQVVIAKLLAAWLATSLLVGLSTVISGIIAMNGAPQDGIVIGFAIAMMLGALVYTAIFVLLSIVTSRALIAGLIYVFFWESVVTSIFSGTKIFSVRQYTLGVARLISTASTNTFDSRLDGNEALWLMAAVSALAIVLAVRRLQRFEIGEST